MKPVLVTGGTRGLGLAVSRRLAHDGYCVIATGRRLTTELEHLIGETHAGVVEFAEMDLAEVGDLQGLIRGLTDTHGPLYGLVNNAAIAHDGLLATMHDTAIMEAVTVNLLGTIVISKYASRSMLLSRQGRIINVASIIAHTGFSGLAVYGATKAALLGFTKSLARELGRGGITVNSVSPGYMQTDMTSSLDPAQVEAIRRRSPLGRLASVEDVASTIAFLLSDEADSISGTDVVVDAGSIA